MKWTKFYPNDWMTGTAGMSPHQKAAYIDLIAYYIAKDGVVDFDIAALARVTHLGARMFRRIADELADGSFIQIEAGKLRIRKCDAEIAKAAQFSKFQREKAKRPRTKRTTNGAANHMQINGSDLAGALPGPNPQIATRALKPDSLLRKGASADEEGRCQQDTSAEEPESLEAETEAPSPDKVLFDYGKQLLGQKAGGQIAKLKKAYGIEGAYRHLRTASEKSDPGEWIGAVLKNTRGNGQHRPPAIDVDSPEYQALCDENRKRALGEA